MSQVLIGIIGVILFIGLALAGAMFLGPQFQNSTNNSRASATVQATSQIAAAYEMYRVQTGIPAADLATLVTDDYMKSLPVNPTSGAAAELQTVASQQVVRMGVGGAAAADICEAINRQATGSETIPVAALGTAPSGCYEATASTGDYYAYTRV